MAGARTMKLHDGKRRTKMWKVNHPCPYFHSGIHSSISDRSTTQDLALLEECPQYEIIVCDFRCRSVRYNAGRLAELESKTAMRSPWHRRHQAIPPEMALYFVPLNAA